MNGGLVTITIPQKGRTCEKSLEKLHEAGFLPDEKKEPLIQAIKSSKSTMSSSIGVVLNELENYTKNGLTELTVLPDREREDRLWRIMFRGYDTLVDGINTRVEGASHDTAPQLIRSHQANIGIFGWDELYAALLEHMQLPTYARKWPGFNSSVKGRTTDLRVIGSAGLGDYVGHFLILHDEVRGELPRKVTVGDYESGRLLELLKNKDIYIDPKYEGIYNNVLGNHILWNFKPTEHVEDTVQDNQAVGIGIVQTGRTLAEKEDLHVVRQPLIQSETVIAVNKAEYENNEKVIKVANMLQPVSYYNPKRRIEVEEWYDTLMMDTIPYERGILPICYGQMKLFLDENDKWIRSYEPESLNSAPQTDEMLETKFANMWREQFPLMKR